MTQGDPLFPAIFNLVVDAVVRHWVAVMVESVEERSGRRHEGRHQNPLFYADEGMVESSDPRRIQGDFSTLVGLFDRVCWESTSFILYKFSNVWIPVTLTSCFILNTRMDYLMFNIDYSAFTI